MFRLNRRRAELELVVMAHPSGALGPVQKCCQAAVKPAPNCVRICLLDVKVVRLSNLTLLSGSGAKSGAHRACLVPIKRFRRASPNASCMGEKRAGQRLLSCGGRLIRSLLVERSKASANVATTSLDFERLQNNFLWHLKFELGISRCHIAGRVSVAPP